MRVVPTQAGASGPWANHGAWSLTRHDPPGPSNLQERRSGDDPSTGPWRSVPATSGTSTAGKSSVSRQVAIDGRPRSKTRPDEKPARTGLPRRAIASWFRSPRPAGRTSRRGRRARGRAQASSGRAGVHGSRIATAEGLAEASRRNSLRPISTPSSRTAPWCRARRRRAPSSRHPDVPPRRARSLPGPRIPREARPSARCPRGRRCRPSRSGRGRATTSRAPRRGAGGRGGGQRGEGEQGEGRGGVETWRPRFRTVGLGHWRASVQARAQGAGAGTRSTVVPTRLRMTVEASDPGSEIPGRARLEAPEGSSPLGSTNPGRAGRRRSTNLCVTAARAPGRTRAWTSAKPVGSRSGRPSPPRRVTSPAAPPRPPGPGRRPGRTGARRRRRPSRSPPARHKPTPHSRRRFSSPPTASGRTRPGFTAAQHREHCPRLTLDRHCRFF